MRIWKLFQRHYEQGVLHKAAKCKANEIRKVIQKHYEKDHFAQISKNLFAQGCKGSPLRTCFLAPLCPARLFFF